MLIKLRFAIARRLRALGEIKSPREFLAVLHVFLMALVITTVLRLRMSKRLLNWLSDRPTGKRAPDEATLKEIVRRTDSVLLLGRPLIRTECLSRTCLLYYQMKRAGADVNVRFGTAADEKGLRFHCWLLVEDEPTYEQFDPRISYRQLYDLHS